MRTKPLIVLAGLIAVAIGCGKEYKPGPGGGEYVEPNISTTSSSSSGPESAVQGTWQFVKIQISTTRTETTLPGDFTQNKFVVSGNKITNPGAPGKGEGDVTVRFTLRPGSPKQVDFIMDGKAGGAAVDVTFRGIYELRGDTIKIAVALPTKGPDAPRPTEFKPSAGSPDEAEPGGSPHVVVIHARRISGGPAGGAGDRSAKEPDASVEVAAPDERPVAPKTKPATKKGSAPPPE